MTSKHDSVRHTISFEDAIQRHYSAMEYALFSAEILCLKLPDLQFCNKPETSCPFKGRKICEQLPSICKLHALRILFPEQKP